MLTLYGIPNCDTVKKARKWLDNQGVAYQFHDYKKMGINPEKLDSWLTQLPWEKLVNRSGMTWRKLPDEQKAAVTDAASAAALLQTHTSAIKRPLIENADGEVVALGFSEKDYEQAFA
ncbi:MAG: ArsC family reductase [Bacteroidetes bacterium]|nr:ArsC family reductase [Bacteroidota bacterium]